MATLDTFGWCTQVQGGGGSLTTTNNDRSIQFGNGYMQLASSGFNTTRREYSVVYAGEDFMAVYDFCDSHRIKPFAWTPPDGKIGIWIVKPNSLGAKPVSRDVMEINVTFMEQFTSME